MRGRSDLEKEYPEWQLWPGEKLVHGWRPKTSPAWKVRGRDWEHLGARMDAFTAAWARHKKDHGLDGSFEAARDAAEDVE